MLQTSTVKESTLGLLKRLQAEALLTTTRLVGYHFDFERIKNRIIKMTDAPDKVYATAPLKRKGI